MDCMAPPDESGIGGWLMELHASRRAASDAEPFFSEVVPTVDFTHEQARNVGLAPGKWAAIFNGWITAPETGTYKFVTHAHDNYMLFVDDKRIDSAWDTTSPALSSIDVELVAVIHIGFALNTAPIP